MRASYKAPNNVLLKKASAAITESGFRTLVQGVSADELEGRGPGTPGEQRTIEYHEKQFLALGLQTAAGVPLQCDEPADFRTFRVGLFGLDKLHNPDRTVEHLAKALDKLLPPVAAAETRTPALHA